MNRRILHDFLALQFQRRLRPDLWPKLMKVASGPDGQAIVGALLTNARLIALVEALLIELTDSLERNKTAYAAAGAAILKPITDPKGGL